MWRDGDTFTRTGERTVGRTRHGGYRFVFIKTMIDMPDPQHDYRIDSVFFYTPKVFEFDMSARKSNSALHSAEYSACTITNNPASRRIHANCSIPNHGQNLESLLFGEKNSTYVARKGAAPAFG